MHPGTPPQGCLHHHTRIHTRSNKSQVFLHRNQRPRGFHQAPGVPGERRWEGARGVVPGQRSCFLPYHRWPRRGKGRVRTWCRVGDWGPWEVAPGRAGCSQVLSCAGTSRKRRPMTAEMTDIRPRADTDPASTCSQVRRRNRAAQGETHGQQSGTERRGDAHRGDRGAQRGTGSRRSKLTRHLQYHLYAAKGNTHNALGVPHGQESCDEECLQKAAQAYARKKEVRPRTQTRSSHC